MDRRRRSIRSEAKKNYEFKINKKERRLALKSALTSKVNENKFIVLDSFNMDEIKTKKFQAVMNNLKVAKALVVLNEKNDNVTLSAEHSYSENSFDKYNQRLRHLKIRYSRYYKRCC